MDEDSWTWYTAEASKNYEQYPIDMMRLHSADFNAWADESFMVAENYVYPGKFFGSL